MNPETGPGYNSPEEEAAAAEFNVQAEAQPDQAKEIIDHQQRLAILKNLRQAFANVGFGESVPAHYVDENDQDSDITMEIDTYAHGKFAAVLNKDGRAEVRYSDSYSDEPQRQKINEAVSLRDMILSGSEHPVTFTLNGKEMELPDEKIPGPKQPDQPEPPNPWPPKDQNVSVDYRTGKWYGSPKS